MGETTPEKRKRERLRELDGDVAAAEKRRDEFKRSNWGHSHCRGCGCKLTLDSSMQMGVCEDCEGLPEGPPR